MSLKQVMAKSANHITHPLSRKNNFFLAAVIFVLLLFAFFLLYLEMVDPLLGLALIAFFILSVVFYFWPYLGLSLVIVSLLLGQLVKMPIGESGAGILVSDILAPIVVFSFFARKLIKKEKIYTSFSGPFLFLFIAVAFISLINGHRFLGNNNQFIVSAFYFIRFLSYALLYFVALDEAREEKKFLFLIKSFIFSFFIFAFLGLLQFLIFPSLAKWAESGGWDPHYERLFSTFLDPNFAGAFLIIGFLFSLALFLNLRSIENKIIVILGMLLIIPSIILTYSRSSYLFLLVSFLAFSLIRSRKLLLLGLAAMIMLLLVFPKSLERVKGGLEIDKSAFKRFESWERTMDIYKDHPALGVGYNSYRFAQERYSFIDANIKDHSASGSDASFLNILATTGTLGFLTYAAFYLSALLKSKREFTLSTNRYKRGLALALFCVLIGLTFDSLFINSLFYPAIMISIFIILGMISSQSLKSTPDFVP